LAIVIGALATGVALALLDMIGFLTNFLYDQRLSVELVSPDASQLGLLPVAVPVFRGLLVGFMPRFGSEQITQFDLLQARQRLLEEERLAERVLSLRRADVRAHEDDPASSEAP
jgi:hypothetical protein